MTVLLRTLRTVRHLTARQVCARAVHEGRVRLEGGASPLLRRVYGPEPAARIRVPGLWRVPIDVDRHREIAERWREGKVRFLAIEGPKEDWRPASMPRLWRYEQQYHSELVSLAAIARTDPSGPWLEEALRLVTSWAEACPPGTPDAWDPYPVSRRILNWSLAVAIEPRLAGVIAPGLSPHVRYLRTRLERHLLGNHLLCNAAALTAGSAILDVPGAERTLAFGARLLESELRRQVLGDGGHAERSAHYHAIVLRDALLANALARRTSDGGTLTAMARWLAAIQRPDGTVPFLNDASPDGVHFAREALSIAEPRAPKPSVVLALPETGWTILRSDSHELTFEHGPIGPPEQPGHGHSDALSYELSWSGLRVVTDSGVTTYEPGAVRDFERSARAHATVTVDDESADELWGSFRVGGRARVSAAPPRQLDSGVYCLRGQTLSHRRWVHDRSLFFAPGKALAVFDRVRGARRDGRVVTRIPLDPAWRVELAADGIALHGPRDLSLRIVVLRGELLGTPSGVLAPREGWVALGFGRPVPRVSLQIRSDAVGRCGYVIVAQGIDVALRDEVCELRGAGGLVELPLDAGDLAAAENPR